MRFHQIDYVSTFSRITSIKSANKHIVRKASKKSEPIFNVFFVCIIENWFWWKAIAIRLVNRFFRMCHQTRDISPITIIFRRLQNIFCLWKIKIMAKSCYNFSTCNENRRIEFRNFAWGALFFQFNCWQNQSQPLKLVVTSTYWVVTMLLTSFFM